MRKANSLKRVFAAITLAAQPTDEVEKTAIRLAEALRPAHERADNGIHCFMVYCDGVFEGGGVKGIALAGAACSFMRRGYRFVHVAGSSAGAIVASLIAAGLTCGELDAAMKDIDYKKLRGKDVLDRFGLPGKLLSLAGSLGVYDLDYLENWLGGVLSAHGVVTFGELAAKYKTRSDESAAPRLRITVTDLTDNRILVLPDGLRELGIDPDGFSIAKAVRMSASIPLYYEPVRLKDGAGRTHYIVDGGVLSNYPVWILDDGISPLARPVFGFRFKEDPKVQRGKDQGKLNLPEYIKAVMSVMTEAHDMSYAYAAKGDKARTVEICSVVDTGGGPEKIDTTDFDISGAQATQLFANGYTAADIFLLTFNFDKWNRDYR